VPMQNCDPVSPPLTEAPAFLTNRAGQRTWKME
jgi:hypothetical protein